MRFSISGLLALGLISGTMLRAPAAANMDPHAIIQKAIQAVGGEEKLSKYQSSILKGKCKFYMMGRAIDATAELHSQPPRQLKALYHFNVGGKKTTRIDVISKDHGWTSMNGKVQPIPEDQLAELWEAMEASQVTSLLPLKEPGYQITSLGESVVGDRPAVGLKVAHQGHRDVLLYFDKERGYLVKTVTRIKPVGSAEVDEETLFADYHNYNGIRNANKQSTKRDGKLFLELETTAFKAVEKIPAHVFAKPGSGGKTTGPQAK